VCCYGGSPKQHIDATNLRRTNLGCKTMESFSFIGNQCTIFHTAQPPRMHPSPIPPPKLQNIPNLPRLCNQAIRTLPGQPPCMCWGLTMQFNSPHPAMQFNSFKLSLSKAPRHQTPNAIPSTSPLPHQKSLLHIPAVGIASMSP
jgi:hypothetical protein